MKRCPQCGREYDLTMGYCLDDGSELLYGPTSMDEPATVTLSGPLVGELPTAIFPVERSVEERRGNSIAVLPFANMSADEENEYFCDGLAEELLNALSKIEDLKVAARTSAFSFKGTGAKVGEIAEALNVDTVLEGSVRKAGSRIRISVQMVNAADGYQLWSERYDREMKDIFDIQDEIAVAVVNALKIQLLGSEKAAMLRRRTENAEAYEFYLRGLSHFNKWTPADFQKAIDNFDRAIAIDPGYVSAYAAIADAHTELAFFSFSSSTDARRKATDAANKALQLDDNLAEAHNSLALIKMYFNWDYSGAEAEFKRALVLNPGGSALHMWYGWYLGLMGRFDESLSELRRARELDPLSPPNINAIGVVLLWSGRTTRAIEQFQDTLELVPNYVIALSFLAEAYTKIGDLHSAISTIEKIEPAAMDPQALSIKGYIYARSGKRDEAMQILERFTAISRNEYVPAINVAQVYAGLGDHEQAFAWLDKAYNQRAIWVPFLKVDLKFEPLHVDPRFKDLLRNVGFAD